MPRSSTASRGERVAMLRRWRLSCLAGAVASVVLVAFVAGTYAPKVVRTQPSDGPPHYDAACEVPGGWATFPVADHFDASRGQPSIAREGMFNELLATTAPLGDVFVRFQSDTCSWGGSACAGQAPTLHH